MAGRTKEVKMAEPEEEEHSNSDAEEYEEGEIVDEEEMEEDEGDEECDYKYEVPELQDVLQKHGAKWQIVWQHLQKMLGHKDLELSNLSRHAQLAFYEWMYEHAYLATHFPLEK